MRKSHVREMRLYSEGLGDPMSSSKDGLLLLKTAGGASQSPILVGLRLSWATSRRQRARRPRGAEGRGKCGGARGLFRAKSWGYSAFQYTLPDQTPKTNRCASRFATTASALRASAAARGGEIAQFP